MKQQNWILTIIVFSQFSCISIWFAGNAVMSNLIIDFELNDNALGHLTSVIQFGFITGTLVFAVFTVADRFSPSKVFFASALLGALFNILIIFDGNSFISLIVLRFLTGFFLAGIYPVGMKIAADYFRKGLGLSLGLLVGALVLGTAFPHILKAFTTDLPWRSVIIITSLLALLGGLSMVILVPNGPFRKSSQEFDLSVFMRVFKNKEFRSAAFGYFGHMWELYAFWTFVPVMLITFNVINPENTLNVPMQSFIIIGIGSLACVLGGYLSVNFGAKKIAFFALAFSGACCLLSPLIFLLNSHYILIAFLLFWGMVVIADSPLFSTLVANNVQEEAKGTALTIVNCIGFSITILSIQLLSFLHTHFDNKFIYVSLAIGPILGLMALSGNSKNKLSKVKL